VKTIAIAALAATIASAALAHDFKIGSIEIDHPWTRATPKGASVAGGYLKITNKGTQEDRLIGGSFDGAGRFEVHEMTMEGGIMKMRPLAKGIAIKPGESVELKPGGYHVMFMDLKAPVEQGKNMKGTLVFEKAGKVDVEYTVEAVGAPPKTEHKGH
jgi:copper(I)-binding protein